MPTFYLQSINALGNLDLEDIVHRVCGGSRAAPPPGIGGLLWLERCGPVAYCASLLSPSVSMDHPVDAHTEPPFCSLHISYPVTHCPMSSEPGGRRPSDKGRPRVAPAPQALGDRRWPAKLEPGREHWGVGRIHVDF